MKVEPTICSLASRTFAGALVYHEGLTVTAPAVLPPGCDRMCNRLGDEGGTA
jgi:hypothetical protein